MKHGSLFSGIGGFDLAADWMGWSNEFHCEINEYNQKKLKESWPNAKTYTDVTKSDFTIYRGRIDVLTGGFPCQDASIAKQDGKGQQGLEGSRTGLYFEMCRAIDEIRPRFVVAENVSNILKVNGGQDFRRILSELARMGYNAEWRVCYASEVGAPTKRSRLYLVAYSNSLRLQKRQTFFSYVRATPSPFTWRPFGTAIQISRAGAWESEPPVLCVGDGFSGKLVRQQLYAYGNAVVPQIPFSIFKSIAKIDSSIKNG